MELDPRVEQGGQAAEDVERALFIRRPAAHRGGGFQGIGDDAEMLSRLMGTSYYESERALLKLRTRL